MEWGLAGEVLLILAGLAVALGHVNGGLAVRVPVRRGTGELQGLTPRDPVARQVKSFCEP